jgi:hypothetical protein
MKGRMTINKETQIKNKDMNKYHQVLANVMMETGQRKWKGNKYEHRHESVMKQMQMLLLVVLTLENIA